MQNAVATTNAARAFGRTPFVEERWDKERVSLAAGAFLVEPDSASQRVPG
jgi:hypothetical protein